MKSSPKRSGMQSVPRRELLAGSAAAAAGVLTAVSVGAAKAQQPDADTNENTTTPEQRRGRIRQSVMGWCFNPMPPMELAKLGQELGLVAIEGISAEYYPQVKQLGLEISLVGSHGFATGPVDSKNHAEVENKLRSSIDTAVKFGAPNVITFTGMRVPGMMDETARRNCVECWKRVIGYAEEKGVTLCLEHLNSRDDSHPMKGHPGYFGDDLDLCMELIHQMDSENFKLLFDIYHVQIMHGDIIRRLRALHPWVAHYHTAGNPGRLEIDEHQEINYPAVMHAILETGYQGYVAQEFIPTWGDPRKSLNHAISTCDV